MTDFARARRTMVDTQVRVNDVTDPRIVDALLAVPRELFVPPALKSLAYLDDDLVVSAPGAPNRHILEVMVFARLIHAAAISADDVVLDVGCASGYSAAVLGRVASSVIAVEEDAALAAEAGRLIAETGSGNVAVITGPLAEGAARHGPFDVIVLEGCVEQVPDALLGQLRVGGRLVALVGTGRSAKAMVFTYVGGSVSARIAFDAASPLLPGFAKTPGFVF
ncbi:MAG: protein-L-isoaspartate O-methyltransferase [Alphaproteobacteria bacterium]